PAHLAGRRPHAAPPARPRAVLRPRAVGAGAAGRRPARARAGGRARGRSRPGRLGGRGVVGLMRGTSWQTLLATGVVVGAVSYLGLTVLETRSGTLVPVASQTWLVLAVVAVVLLLLGRSVHRLTEGRATRMD